MATRKQGNKSAKKQPASTASKDSKNTKNKSGKKTSSSGILNKAKGAVSEILTGAAAGAAAGALNVAADAVSSLLEGGAGGVGTSSGKNVKASNAKSKEKIFNKTNNRKSQVFNCFCKRQH